MKETKTVKKPAKAVKAAEPTSGAIVTLYALDSEGKMKLVGQADEVQLKQIKKLIK